MNIVEKELNGKTYFVHEWKYNAEQNKEWGDTGYQDLNKTVLNKYNCQDYALLTEEEKEKTINDIVQIFRSRNIYIGTYYYTHNDIIEEIQYCKEKEMPKFDGNVLDKRPTLGNLLLKFLFPNFFLIDCKGVKNNNLYSRFYDDHKLYRSIKYCFDFKPKVKEPILSYSVQRGMELIGGNSANNYLPMKVRMLLEYYMPKGGNFLDFSCGFGSRLLGSQCANVEGSINYFGFEPCAETYYHLNELKQYIYEAFNIKEEGRINLYEQGSEEFLPKEVEGNMDFIFSCPPYYSLEDYTNSTDERNEDKGLQCYNKYPTLEEWKNKYVLETVKNIYKALKPGCYYAVNIADFRVGNEQVKFVNDWLEISRQVGFTLEKEIPNKMGKSRPNNLTISGAYIPKDEAIYLFKK